ncbi:MAG: hypothetical protein V3W34_18485 [Phycisphaerae bacterium]
MSSRRALAMAVAITSSLIICSDAARAGTFVYVDANAGGAGDGTSWCDAYATLDAALGAIALGTIRVADGTYTPDPTGLADPRDATFALISGVTIEGGYPGCGAVDPDQRDIDAHPTILTGDSNGDDDSGGDNSENCYHVVTAGGVDETAVLDGWLGQPWVACTCSLFTSAGRTLGRHGHSPCMTTEVGSSV